MNCIPDYQYLKNISEISGGKFILNNEIDKVNKYITQREGNLNLKLTKKNRKYFLLLLYLILNYSWFLRRKKGMI